MERTRARAHSRSRRVNRTHLLLYSLRVFAPANARLGTFDQDWLCEQRIPLKEDERFPMQGYLQAVDPASRARNSEVANAVVSSCGPPPLQPPPPKVPHKAAPRPRGAAAASSSTDVVAGTRAALSKGNASAFFVMALTSKGRPPARPEALKRPRPSSSSLGGTFPALKRRKPSSMTVEVGSLSSDSL